jgi:hypothetical protein
MAGISGVTPASRYEGDPVHNYIQGMGGVKLLTGIVIITPGGLYNYQMQRIPGYDYLPVHNGINSPGVLESGQEAIKW